MNLKESVKGLQNMVTQGKTMEAFERYYAEGVEMQENHEPVRKGKKANREFEKKFMESVKEFHGATLKCSAIDEKTNTAFLEWEFDCTFLDGKRVIMDEVSVQHWKDGKIDHEKFYYSKG